jgi:signal transduction histidine kinase
VAQRLFLLHHAANLLLGVMGVLLAMRFIDALTGLETANRTLEARVQAREREIAASYDRIAALQREQAATDERQRIMRDLHDGLGSQLFVSLSRAERGMLDAAGMTGTLRSAIDQMRVAIEALTSEEQDFLTAFGNFRFRWDNRLRDAGLHTDWEVDLGEDGPGGEAVALAPHNALQLLHIVQEALTNVLKHARAQTVAVRLARDAAGLRLTVADDGRREAPAPSAGGGRGLANMNTRAQRLGGKLEITVRPEGTTVSLLVPAALVTRAVRSA